MWSLIPLPNPPPRSRRNSDRVWTFVSLRQGRRQWNEWGGRVVGMKRGQRQGRRARLPQRGESVFRRKLRLSDKTAERVALGLLSPAPRFGSLGLLLGKQETAIRGKIVESVEHRCKTRLETEQIRRPTTLWGQECKRTFWTPSYKEFCHAKNQDLLDY